MANIMIETQPLKVTYSLPELFFFYDPLQKKVIFSSPSTLMLSSIPVEIHDDIHWTGLTNEDRKDVESTWDECMQLKSGESKQFLIQAGRGYGFEIFRVIATGVELNDRVFIHCYISGQPPVSKLEKDQNEFVDIAAHDLDAPLRKLSLLVDTLLEKHKQGNGADISPYVPRIQKCVGDMRSLIESLAVLSRAGISSPSSKQVTFNLGEVAREVIADMDVVIREKNATIELEPLPDITGNRSQFKTLLANIIENALRFVRPGEEPHVAITSALLDEEEKKLHALVKDLNYIKIKITDNGIGIIPEDREKIFRPFVRLNGKSEFAGNGIGLAIGKKIIENHGGILYADQHAGTGSSFILIIPQTIS
jgi:signal transduction histidine kinase